MSPVTVTLWNRRIRDRRLRLEHAGEIGHAFRHLHRLGGYELGHSGDVARVRRLVERQHDFALRCVRQVLRLGSGGSGPRPN